MSNTDKGSTILLDLYKKIYDKPSSELPINDIVYDISKVIREFNLPEDIRAEAADRLLDALFALITSNTTKAGSRAVIRWALYYDLVISRRLLQDELYK